MNYNTKEEIWKDVVGYEGYYRVSNKGRVKSIDRTVIGQHGKINLKGKMLSTPKNEDGYECFGLTRDGKAKGAKVHRVVAEAFIPNPNNYPEINHKDEDKANNVVENIEWCDRKYNMNYGTVQERMMSHPNRIKAHEESKREIVAVCTKTLKETYFESITKADEEGYKRRNIWSAIVGNDATHKGHVWFYSEGYNEHELNKKLKRARGKIVASINESGDIVKVYGSVSEAAKVIGVDASNVSRSCNSVGRKTKGHELIFI